MHILKSSVGRKLIMSVTGFGLIFFVIVHLLGNTTIYSGPDSINSYAFVLQSLTPFVWIFRLTMLGFLSLHVIFGIQLTLENRAAKPLGYAVNYHAASTFAGRNMIWTGLLIIVFIAFHLLHFTFQFITPGVSALANPDPMGRPDVYTMVVSNFQMAVIAGIYAVALAGLGLHLSHSIQSAMQTLGLNSEKTFSFVQKAGFIAAVLIFLGYVSFPLLVLAGVIR